MEQLEPYIYFCRFGFLKRFKKYNALRIVLLYGISKPLLFFWPRFASKNISRGYIMLSLQNSIGEEKNTIALTLLNHSTMYSSMGSKSSFHLREAVAYLEKEMKCVASK